MFLCDTMKSINLQRGMTLSPEAPDRREHVDRLAEVLRSVPRAYRMSMLTAIEEQDADLNKVLMKKMYRFDDLISLESRIVQRVLVRPSPDYTGTLIEVESLEAAHAYLMATPTGSPWEVV